MENMLEWPWLNGKHMLVSAQVAEVTSSRIIMALQQWVVAWGLAQLEWSTCLDTVECGQLWVMPHESGVWGAT